jgi:hypothetical protein
MACVEPDFRTVDQNELRRRRLLSLLFGAQHDNGVACRRIRGMTND